MNISFALVHHANQYLITDGYEHREGISDIVGSEYGEGGILRLLEIHRRWGVPANLHLSGTLLEAIAWHCPQAIDRIREYLADGLIELIGSCYGQNIMRFFSPDYNRRQLNEQLKLYESLLGVAPGEVQVFWPPERVWDTRRMAPVLRDAALLNNGYRYVILDDRTLLSPRDSDLPRAVYDEQQPWAPELYQSHQIESGLGLVAIPIGVRLRQCIPPKKEEDWDGIQSELESLLVHAADAGPSNLLALYADDMEKVIGVWGKYGPARYEEFVEWLCAHRWIEPVKLSHWLQNNPQEQSRKIEPGTFAELARDFNAGEGYENWFYSDAWSPYRNSFEQTERHVKECKKACGASPLIELAEKQLLASNWETAWHTPATGAHGDPIDNGQPSPWARALTSHCRHALVTVEAARWEKDRDGRAHAMQCDVDLDGETDLVMKNDRMFAMLSPRWGGRLIGLFYLGPQCAAMVVGNPCDDWNFLEHLNRFMNVPRNHPGAFADVEFENDRYACEITPHENRVAVVLTNVEPGSRANGLRKTYEINSSEPELCVTYSLPPSLDSLSVECGLSPDYLSLLRHGSTIMSPLKVNGSRGYSARGISVVLEPGPQAVWEEPLQDWIGHGRTLRIACPRPEFQLRLRVFENTAQEDAA